MPRRSVDRVRERAVFPVVRPGAYAISQPGSAPFHSTIVEWNARRVAALACQLIHSGASRSHRRTVELGVSLVSELIVGLLP